MSDTEKLQNLLLNLGLDDKYEEVVNRESTLFDALDNLYSLDLTALGITDIYEDAFVNFKYLNTIELGHNDLTDIPAKLFTKNSTLRKIGLNDNLLMELHEDIFNSQHYIQDIDLGGNQILRLPDNIFERNSSLFRLTLQRNPLLSLPKSLSKLYNLNYLDLSGTQYGILLTDKEVINTFIQGVV